MLNSISFLILIFFIKKLSHYIYIIPRITSTCQVFLKIFYQNFGCYRTHIFFWHIFCPLPYCLGSCTGPQRSSPLKGAVRSSYPLINFYTRGGLPRTFVRKELEPWYQTKKKRSCALPYSLFYFF